MTGYDDPRASMVGVKDKDGKYPKLLLEEFYKPTEEIQEFIFDIYTKYIQWKSLREQPYKQFNLQTCSDYWQDARQKYWGYLPVSFDNDTPQFFFPETRNQITQVLAKIANLKMKPRFEGVEGFDILKATLLKSLFEYWRRGANRKIANFWQFLYAVINGTVIVHTAYNSKIRNVKNITLYDASTGETQWTDEKLDESDVEDVICYLEDIYFPKLWEPDIQQQDEIIWRTMLKLSDFKNAFKGYPLSKYVMPGSQFSDTSIFSDFLSYDIRGSDFVEVFKYYNASKDMFGIIANGVLLNPVIDAKSKNEVPMPLPWNHKRLPFSKTIFEPIDSSFFYGMPLAQKVKSPQEALNRMWELLIERETKSVNAPIITTDPSVELGLEFKAGHIYQVQAPPDQYKELAVGGASASYWNALTALQGIIVRTGSGGMSPTLPSRQPRSATEKSQEAQTQRENSGLYFMFYQDLLEQKVWLTIENQIQFYTAEKNHKILGDREFHRILALTEVQLYGGGMGNREIRITDNPLPPNNLKKESYMRSLLRKERVEIIEVSPEALRKVRFDIKIDFEQENSPETERALFMDYVVTMIKLFGQTGLLSLKKMMYRTIEKFGESIIDVVEDKVVEDYNQERFGVSTVKAQSGNLPTVDNFKQQMTGQQFGAEGAGQRMANEGQTPENIFKKF